MFWFFVVIVAGVDCEIECVRATESTNIHYISATNLRTIKLNIKESFKFWCSLSWRGANILTKMITFLIRKRHFEAGAINTNGNT